MKKSIIVFKSAIVITSLLSTALIAQDMPLAGPIPFSVYDRNKDGFISNDEFNDTRAKRISIKQKHSMPMRNAANAPDFSFFDVDKNGKLSKLELREGQNRQMRKNRAKRNLVNKYMRRDMPTFESFDLNGDGYLKGDEMKEARAKRIEKKAAQGKMLRNSTNPSKFSDIDANDDGIVTKEEFITNQMKKKR